MSAVATIAPELFDLMRGALDELSGQQRRVYELTHGIDANGQTEDGEMSAQQVADLLGISRGAANWHLAQAERTVYRTIAMHLYRAELKRIDDEEIPTPGPSTAAVPAFSRNHYDPHHNARGYTEAREGDNLHYQLTRAGTGGIVLGPGSERHVREAKRSDAKGRTDALVRAHQECVGVLA